AGGVACDARAQGQVPRPRQGRHHRRWRGDLSRPRCRADRGRPLRNPDQPQARLMLRIEAALTGSLAAVVKQEQERAALAITTGTHGAGDALKARLRAMVISAFGSQRLANTWRGMAFPAKGRTSLGPTDLVYSKAPHIIEAFSKTTTIRGSSGFWLAI